MNEPISILRKILGVCIAILGVGIFIDGMMRNGVVDQYATAVRGLGFLLFIVGFQIGFDAFFSGTKPPDPPKPPKIE